MKIDRDKFADDFWNEFKKLVPDHLRPKISVHHYRFMIDAFFKTLEMQDINISD